MVVNQIDFVPYATGRVVSTFRNHEAEIGVQWLKETSLSYFDTLRDGKAPLIRTSLAWKGACWCSDQPLGGLYGPGPGDPYLPVGLVRSVFEAVETVDPDDGDTCMRMAFILSLFEAIALAGLDDSHQNPLFTSRYYRVNQLLDIPHPSLIGEWLQEYSRDWQSHPVELDEYRDSKPPRLDTAQMSQSLFSFLENPDQDASCLAS